MGAKGKKRREKNYLAAHGGPARLPPPPKHSQLEALPSKLRMIMSLASSVEDETKKKSADESQKKSRQKNEGKTVTHGSKVGAPTTSRNPESGEEIAQMNVSSEKKKKKRKRKEVTDLRFETELAGGGSKRREKKKKYFDAKKEKRKKAKTNEDSELHKKEKIEFGEVVEAPPKLVSVPKPFKTTQHASKERIRLQAVEAYRERKGWSSRLGGIKLPPSALP